MTLDNLFEVNQINREAVDERETQGFIRAANDRLNKAVSASLSYASRLDLAYSTAHGFVLAAFTSQRISIR